MQIRAAVAAVKSQPFSIEMLELEDPRDDEVLVRMVGTSPRCNRATTCRWTRSIRRQTTPSPGGP